MATEPPTKKLKLSSSDEPLTQHDVISFQKEALYRCLNEKRVGLGAITEQYEISKKNYVDISTKLSNLMALIITLANFLMIICKEKNNKQDEDICCQMATGDENEVIQLSDSFMRVLTKYVNSSSDGPSDENGRLSNLALELKELQKVKKELYYKNNELTQEIDSMKIYYEKLIKKYDREDSQTVKRVFKKDVEKYEDNDDSKPIEKQPDVKQEDIKKEADIKKEPSSELITNEKKDDDEVATENGIAQKKLIAEYEIRTTDLHNEIKGLKLLVDELEKFKSSNEEKIISLEQKLSAAAELNSGTVPGSSIANLDSIQAKVDHLARENNELRQVNDSFLGKFQDLFSEREIFNNKITNEFNNSLEALKKQNLTLEKDLIRIRTARDDLLSKVSILESETKAPILLEDLKKSIDLSNEQWKNLEDRQEQSSEDLLLNEMQGMEKAFKDLTEINNKKYSDLINQESIISKLKIEKTKADQKYFAAMRSKDSILVENKNLSKTITKSNELLLQLKDSEKLLQQKIENLYKQLKLSQNNEKRLIDSNKSESMKIIDLNSQINKFDKKIINLKNENLTLISDVNKLKTSNHDLEAEKKILISNNSDLNEKCEKIYKKLVSFSGKADDKKGHYSNIDDEDTLVQELENFRTLVYCSLCSKNWKNMAIKTCGHVFCEGCCNERLAARMRKCPSCNYPFSSNDLLPIHL